MVNWQGRKGGFWSKRSPSEEFHSGMNRDPTGRMREMEMAGDQRALQAHIDSGAHRPITQQVPSERRWVERPESHIHCENGVISLSTA